MPRALLAPLLAALAALLFGGAAHAEERSALNRAGEQRMLSQRIVKSYGQIALGTMTRQAAEQLRDSVRRFEDNMAALAPLAARADAKLAHEQLAKAWPAFRARVFELPTPESAWVLARMSEDLLARAERLALAFGATPGVPSVAGRQRMLSQRVAKAYVLIALGLDTGALRDELRGASELFAAGLETLGRRPDNTAEMRLELEELALQWEWLRNAIAIDGAVSYRLIVAESAEAILDIADRLTGLYERAGTAGVARARKERS